MNKSDYFYQKNTFDFGAQEFQVYIFSSHNFE